MVHTAQQTYTHTDTLKKIHHEEHSLHLEEWIFPCVFLHSVFLQSVFTFPWFTLQRSNRAHNSFPSGLLASREWLFVIVQINAIAVYNHVHIYFSWLWMYSVCMKHISETTKGWVENKLTQQFHFTFSSSAGDHVSTAKVRLDLAPAECKVQWLSRIECVLLTWQTTFLQT